jgi:hypothetical protein
MTQRKPQAVDASDGMVTLGLLLLAAAIWWAWGLAAVLAYAGMVFVIMGFSMAYQRARTGRRNE